MTDYLEQFRVEHASLELAHPEEVGNVRALLHRRIFSRKGAEANVDLIDPLVCLFTVSGMLCQGLWGDYDVLVAEREVSADQYRAVVKVMAGRPCISIALYRAGESLPILYLSLGYVVDEGTSSLYKFLRVKNNRGRLQVVWELYTALRALYCSAEELRNSAAQKIRALQDAFGRILERAAEEVPELAERYGHTFSFANLVLSIAGVINGAITEMGQYNALLKRPSSFENLGMFPVVVTEYGVQVGNMHHVMHANDVDQWWALYEALVTTYRKVVAARKEAEEAVIAKAKEYPKSAALLRHVMERRGIPLPDGHYPTTEAACLFGGLRGLRERAYHLIYAANDAVGILPPGARAAYGVEYIPNSVAAAILACSSIHEFPLSLVNDEELVEAIAALDEYCRRLASIPDRRHQLRVNKQPASVFYAHPL